MKLLITHHLLLLLFLINLCCTAIADENKIANATTTNSSKPKEDPLPDVTNVRYKVKNIDSPLADIHWCGKNFKELKEEESAKPPNMVVLVLSHGGTIYRSEDDGFNWEEMRDTFAEAGKQVDKKNKVIK